MSKTCKRQFAGGKGNLGMFIDRQPNVCAAGVPSPLNEPNVSAILGHYSLQDEVDALIYDSILPLPPKPGTRPLSHRQPILDMRNAGSFTEARYLINPPMKTKFETLIEDFKETVYTSYWNKPVGKVPDPVGKLPSGVNIYDTTFGHKPPKCERLYEIIMPKTPIQDKIHDKEPGRRTSRNYCQSTFKPDSVFGIRHNVDKVGCLVKRCLTDERVAMGTHLKKPIPAKQLKHLEKTQANLGVPLTPNNYIAAVPQGHVFGVATTQNALGVSECMTNCDLNPQRELLKKSLANLNTLRRCLSKRFDKPYFKKLYLSLRNVDTCKKGWLPKKLIYEYCKARFIHIDANLLEPLLSLWNILKASEIEYKSFVNIMDFTEPSQTLPPIWDVQDLCIENRTTYSEMTKRGQEVDTRLRAGLPSGRYFDKDIPFIPEKCCKADEANLSHETDSRVCLNPSYFSLLGVTHRDMYAKREPITIRKVFEAAGEKFTDESFDIVWGLAKKYHSQGLVSFETFRRALGKFKVGEKEVNKIMNKPN